MSVTSAPGPHAVIRTLPTQKASTADDDATLYLDVSQGADIALLAEAMRGLLDTRDAAAVRAVDHALAQLGLQRDDLDQPASARMRAHGTRLRTLRPLPARHAGTRSAPHTPIRATRATAAPARMSAAAEAVQTPEGAPTVSRGSTETAAPKRVPTAARWRTGHPAEQHAIGPWLNHAGLSPLVRGLVGRMVQLWLAPLAPDAGSDDGTRDAAAAPVSANDGPGLLDGPAVCRAVAGFVTIATALEALNPAAVASSVVPLPPLAAWPPADADRPDDALWTAAVCRDMPTGPGPFGTDPAGAAVLSVLSSRFGPRPAGRCTASGHATRGPTARVAAHWIAQTAPDGPRHHRVWLHLSDPAQRGTTETALTRAGAADVYVAQPDAADLVVTASVPEPRLDALYLALLGAGALRHMESAPITRWAPEVRSVVVRVGRSHQNPQDMTVHELWHGGRCVRADADSTEVRARARDTGFLPADIRADTMAAWRKMRAAAQQGMPTPRA